MSGDRIANAKQCTYDFITKLSDDDTFSVIKFNNSAYEVIPTTKKSDTDLNDVYSKIMSITDNGGTNFDAALSKCLDTLVSQNENGNIIVFLSDGESNVSDSVLAELSNKDIRIASVALGSGSDTSVMKKLSDSTNGQYIYAENSSDLEIIYQSIQGSLIGVDATDSDGDSIPDIIETTGMKNQYGSIIRTDPNKYDTDGDGKSDGEEMGSIVETDNVTEMDKINGITSCVYFSMISYPLDGVTDTNFTNNNTSVNLSASATEMDYSGCFDLNIEIIVEGTAKNLYIEFNTADCIEWDMSDEETGMIRLEYAHTDYNGTIYKERLTSGKYKAVLHMDCHELIQGNSCGNNHDVTLTIHGDNFNNSATTVKVNKKSAIGDTNNNGGIDNTIVNQNKYDQAEFNMTKISADIVRALYGNAQDNISDNIADARNELRNNISITSTSKDKTVPDEALDAFATAIYNALDASKIVEYETDMEKLAGQIYDQVKGGISSKTSTITIDGVQYNVICSVYAINSIAVAFQIISWGGHQAIFTWSNVKTKDGQEAIANYCAALAQLNNNLWKDFLASYVSDGAKLLDAKNITKENVRKVLDYTEKVIKALNGEPDELISSMGDVAKEKFKKGFLTNGYEKFVEDYVPNGENIVKASKKYKAAEDKLNKYKELWISEGDSDKADKAYRQFEAAYEELEHIVNGF